MPAFSADVQDHGWLVVVTMGAACVLASCDARHASPEAAPSASGAVERAAIVASAPVTGAASAPASGETRASSRCVSFCSHTESLHCGTMADCEQGCRQMIDANVCRPQVVAFFDCAEREPLDHWECGNGAPSMKDGWCDAPQAAFVACFKAANPH